MATPESLTSSASHVTKQERDELCIALTAAQESAIIQLLLEICLPTEEDNKVSDEVAPVILLELRLNKSIEITLRVEFHLIELLDVYVEILNCILS